MDMRGHARSGVPTELGLYTQYVGEIALLLDMPRTASVRTLEPTCLLALHKDDFDHLVTEHLYISRGLEQESSRRMSDLRRAIPQA